jgi:hypothetical protein
MAEVCGRPQLLTSWPGNEREREREREIRISWSILENVSYDLKTTN